MENAINTLTPGEKLDNDVLSHFINFYKELIIQPEKVKDLTAGGRNSRNIRFVDGIVLLAE